MASALLAAVAVWLVVPSSALGRSRRILRDRVPARKPDVAILAAAMAPLVAVVVLGLPWGPLAGLAVAPLVHHLVGRLESTAVRRRKARIEAALPAALDLMVAALEVGRPTTTAFALVAEATPDPLGAELATVAGRLAMASDPEAVWQSVAADPALAPIGRALRRAATTGMPVAQIVSAVADELRRERVARLREHGQRVGVKTAAPLGLCFLPAFFLIGIVPTLVATFTSLSW